VNRTNIEGGLGKGVRQGPWEEDLGLQASRDDGGITMEGFGGEGGRAMNERCKGGRQSVQAHAKKEASASFTKGRGETENRES